MQIENNITDFIVKIFVSKWKIIKIVYFINKQYWQKKRIGLSNNKL